MISVPSAPGFPAVKHPKERLPTFRRRVDKYLAWAHQFAEYAKPYDFYPVFGNQIRAEFVGADSALEYARAG